MINLIIFQKINSYELLTTCEFALSPKWDNNKIAYIDGFLGDGNYLEGVANKDCYSLKHPICSTIFFDRNAHEFYQLKFKNRFKNYLTDEIDIILIKINSRQSKNLVHIMFIGVSGRRKKKLCGLTTHQPGLTMSNLMFRVVLSTSWSLGVDWILSIDRNITLGPQHRNAVCSFTLERKLDLILSTLRKPFIVSVGKSLLIIQMWFSDLDVNLAILDELA